MTSQKRDPHRHSDKHWPSLLEVARTLYGSAQFAISSARRLSVFRSVPVSKFEERPGKYNSRFEYAQARGIRPLQDQTCFRIAWRLRKNIKCFREVSMIIFLDILKTDSVRHAGEVLKTMRINKMPKVDDWVYLKPWAMFEIAWDF